MTGRVGMRGPGRITGPAHAVTLAPLAGRGWLLAHDRPLEDKMIIRTWSGRTDPARRDAYPAHFRDVVLPDLGSVDGFLGADLVMRERDGLVEFMVLTRWASMAAIHAFAGDDASRAVVEPGATAALADFDQTVAHYEVLEHV